MDGVMSSKQEATTDDVGVTDSQRVARELAGARRLQTERWRWSRNDEGKTVRQAVGTHTVVTRIDGGTPLFPARASHRKGHDYTTNIQYAKRMTVTEALKEVERRGPDWKLVSVARENKARQHRINHGDWR